MTTELTIVIPTFNEKENIYPLLDLLEKTLAGILWEVIFVDDDSPDLTYAEVRKIACSDSRVRCIQRLGRKGLASACVEGVLASSSPYICIMDADMQHDEKIIPNMLEAVKQEDLDIVVGSRYIKEGSTGTLAPHRVWISKAATYAGQLLLKTSIEDPMSGFFMFKRTYFERIMYGLSIKGFKILLDMLVTSSGNVRCMEVPYKMRERVRGESKLGTQVVWEFFTLFADKLLGRIVPVRFVSFVAVGFSGMLVHLLVLWVLFQLQGTGFIPAQALATLVAMTSNYFLNNHFTYRDRKLKGRKLFYGLISFYIACSLGAIINLAFSGWMYEYEITWWIAGLSGAMAGAVWNYAVTAIFTWRNLRDDEI